MPPYTNVPHTKGMIYLMRFGQNLLRCFLENKEEAADHQTTTANLSMAYFGFCELARRGETYPHQVFLPKAKTGFARFSRSEKYYMAIGTLLQSVFGVG